jgi:hypothetical protein
MYSNSSSALTFNNNTNTNRSSINSITNTYQQANNFINSNNNNNSSNNYKPAQVFSPSSTSSSLSTGAGGNSGVRGAPLLPQSNPSEDLPDLSHLSEDERKIIEAVLQRQKDDEATNSNIKNSYSVSSR